MSMNKNMDTENKKNFPHWVRFILFIGAFYAFVIFAGFLGDAIAPRFMHDTLRGLIGTALFPISGFVFVLMLFFLSLDGGVVGVNTRELFLKGVAKKFFIFWICFYTSLIPLKFLSEFVFKDIFRDLVDTITFFATFPITAIFVPYILTLLAFFAQKDSQRSLSEIGKPSAVFIAFLVPLGVVSFLFLMMAIFNL